MLHRPFLATAFAAALGLGACLAGPAAAQNVLRIANMGEPATLDPHNASGTWENRILGDLFLGLTTEAADGRMVPGAAESWQASADGLVYTFNLRAHTWSDGKAVTADDFVYSLRRILAPETAAKYASLLYPIKNAEALNSKKMTGMENLGVKALAPNRLEITLERPTPYFLAQLTHYTAWPVPKHVIDKFGKDWVKAGNLVGNGAFTLAEWTPNSQIRLVKNPRFYDAANVKLDQVVFYPGEDRAAAVNRFRAGEIDVATDFASDQIDLLRQILAKETHIAPYLGIYYYTFNTKVKPFDDLRVRQALSMAIDRAAITDKVMKTGELPAYSFVPPGVDNYGPPVYVDWKDAALDVRVAKAKALLADAGFNARNPLKLTISYNTSENHRRIAVAVAAMWKDLGVEAELRNAEVAVHYEDMQQGKYQVGRAGWIADYNDPQNFLFLLQTSTGALNYAKYSNAKFDGLMDQAAKTADLKARATSLAQAEATILVDQPYIPIYYYVSKNLVAQHVKGWTDNTKDTHRSRWLSIQR